jgi:hypothetical protein
MMRLFIKTVEKGIVVKVEQKIAFESEERMRGNYYSVQVGENAFAL